MFQVISDKTSNDLDLEEVFMLADRTISKVGQQYFYYIFRTIPENHSRHQQTENLINIFKEKPEVKTSTLLQLSKLSKNDAFYITSLFQDDHIQKPRWFWLIPLLSLGSLVSIIFSFFIPQFLLILVLLLCINYIVHIWNKNNLYQYNLSIPQLIVLSQVVKEILKSVPYRQQDNTIKRSIQVIDDIGFKMSFFKLEAKLQSDVGAIVDFLVEIIKALFLIEPLVLFQVLQALDSKREEIERVYSYIGEIDTAISISSLREGLPYYALPDMTGKSKHIIGKDIYHPLIKDFVPNSIELKNRSALLTGSNMSGKTTFIRTIGINALLSQTINTCFARQFSMPPLKIHSAIRIADDLMSDKSYYFEEVLTIKKMLEESRNGHQNLFLLDELFKGTNTVERIAAGKSVLSYLNSQENIVFISTHDLELADYLKGTYSLYHFTEVVENQQILFDYKLKEGNLQTTNAIRILELNDYPAEVIKEAKELSEKIGK